MLMQLRGAKGNGRRDTRAMRGPESAEQEGLQEAAQVAPRNAREEARSGCTIIGSDMHTLLVWHSSQSLQFAVVFMFACTVTNILLVNQTTNDEVTE
jgi:hypothetical protein